MNDATLAEVDDGDDLHAIALIVIPAKAGIHSSANRMRKDGSRLSPG
jgi:hypothetical protein